MGIYRQANPCRHFADAPFVPGAAPCAPGIPSILDISRCLAGRKAPADCRGCTRYDEDLGAALSLYPHAVGVRRAWDRAMGQKSEGRA